MPPRIVFLIDGTHVSGRMLPSEDWAIWHPYNDRVRAVVEPLCRTHGYWSDEFKNWVVRRDVAARVIATLERVGKRYA